MATKRNSVPTRIDSDLNELLEEIKNKNDMTKRQASRELAKQIREMRKHGKVIQREVVF